MLRLNILQSVNETVLKLNINENRFLTKCMNNLKISNRTVETKDTSKLQDTTDSNIDDDVHKQIKDKKVMLQKQQRDSKLSKKNNLKSVNTFKIRVNIKSVSIFGSETVENCGIQCTEDNKDLKFPTVAHILSETMSPKVKAALERWKKNMIDMYGEECFKSYCKGITFV